MNWSNGPHASGISFWVMQQKNKNQHKSTVKICLKSKPPYLLSPFPLVLQMVTLLYYIDFCFSFDMIRCHNSSCDAAVTLKRTRKTKRENKQHFERHLLGKKKGSTQNTGIKMSEQTSQPTNPPTKGINKWLTVGQTDRQSKWMNDKNTQTNATGGWL